MKIEIYKTSPKDMFLTVRLNNKNWLTCRCEEQINEKNCFVVELEFKEKEFGQWIVSHCENEE